MKKIILICDRCKKESDNLIKVLIHAFHNLDKVHNTTNFSCDEAMDADYFKSYEFCKSCYSNFKDVINNL